MLGRVALAHPVRIELLHVPGCANEAAARSLLKSCLAELRLTAPIEDREGDYPSPTILVDGVDVMGKPPVEGAMCRLNGPTRDRIRDTLRPS